MRRLALALVIALAGCAAPTSADDAPHHGWRVFGQSPCSQNMSMDRMASSKDDLYFFCASDGVIYEKPN